MKNLLIGITVGILSTLLIVSTILYVDRTNRVETAAPTLIPFETSTPMPFGMDEAGTPIPASMEETSTPLPTSIASTPTKVP